MRLTAEVLFTKLNSVFELNRFRFSPLVNFGDIYIEFSAYITSKRSVVTQQSDDLICCCLNTSVPGYRVISPESLGNENQFSERLHKCGLLFFQNFIQI